MTAATAPATNRDIVFQAMYGNRMVATWTTTDGRRITDNDSLEAYTHKHTNLILQRLRGWDIISAWVNYGDDEPHEVRLNVTPDPNYAGDRQMGQTGTGWGPR